MSKENQIEEMAVIINKAKHDMWEGNCKFENHSEMIAEYLYTAGYRKQSEWISVEERLPEILGTYLVVIKLKYSFETEWEYHVDAASYGFDGWETYHDWDEGQECHITHWVPLPEAPKMKGGD